MFLAIPLESRPTWRNPPWMTVLLILINVFIYWGPQHTEEVKVEKAHAFYFASTLPDIELPIYVEFLKQKKSPKFDTANRWLQKHGGEPLLDMMESDAAFADRLDTAPNKPKALLAPSAPQFQDWQAQRQAYAKLKPAPFTQRWAQKHGESLGDVSWTWVTSAFLHGSPGHLIGNMVFLFLFGWSVEIALGRMRYLAFYMLGAIGSSALCVVAYANGSGYGLGASGAISCVMVLYAMLYKLRSIKFFYLILFYFNYVRAPAWILVPLWMLNEIVSWAFVHSNVAYAAHLGGMLTGLVLTKWMPAQQVLDQALRNPAADRAPTAAEIAAQAQALVGKMQWLAACELWKRAVRLSPQDASILRRYFHTARHARDDAHLQFVSLAIFACRSAQPHTVELQQECWRWCKKNAGHLLSDQEPALLGMVQRWIFMGSHADTDALLRDLQKSPGGQALWLDAVERYATTLVKIGQSQAAEEWKAILTQLRPGAPVLAAPR